MFGMGKIFHGNISNAYKRVKVIKPRGRSHRNLHPEPQIFQKLCLVYMYTQKIKNVPQNLCL